MNPQPTWRHDLRTTDRHTTVELAGEIDMSAPDNLQHLPDQAVDTAREVTVDLAAVRFIDSTVISAFIKIRNTATAHDRRFVVANSAAQVRRVLQITGVLDALTEDAA